MPGGGWAPHEVCSERCAVHFLDPFCLTRLLFFVIAFSYAATALFPSRVL
jgi:hypothetical protein